MIRKIFKNAFVSIIQVGVSGVSLFILYHYLLLHLGIEKVGVWSVVLATTSVSRLSEMGLSGSVIKFIAKYNSLYDAQKVNSVIQTAVISLSVFLGLVFLVLYYPLSLIISHVIPEEMLQVALELLPYSLTVLWISTVAGVYQSALEGCQRNDLRGIIIMIASIIHLVFAILLTSYFGLLGLAYAQIIQALVVLMLSVSLLKKEMRHLILIPNEWNWETFKEMFLYGISFQAGSIFMMLFDPITKILLSKYGGVAMVGYFEMANRMVLQFRAILVAANQVLVPVIAGMYETNIKNVHNIYKKSFSIIFFISFPFYGVLSISVPFISVIWLGEYEPFFVMISCLLILSWHINTIVGPAYFANLGIGTIKWNTLGQMSTGVVNCILGPVLGFFFSGRGVIIAYFISLITGSVLTFYKFHGNNKIKIRMLIEKEDVKMVFVNVLGVMLFWFYIIFINDLFKIQFSLIIFTLIIIILFFSIPTWCHPMRKKIFNVIANKSF